MSNPITESEARTGNLFDYVKWRGDVPFSVSPFNEIDNVILSTICYVDLEDIVPSGDTFESIRLDQASTRFWETHDPEDIRVRNPASGYAPFLLRELRTSRRFRTTRLSSYVNEVDEKNEYQFSAVTYTLEDGSYYVAFRGTDDSKAGWKEDFNLSYMAKTRGQQRAVEYLNDHFSGKNLPLRIGGHSKGGNFAVYASMHAEPEVKDTIRKIYSNDGPGFAEFITASDDYQNITHKLEKFIPEGSIIGILLDNDKDEVIVRSSESGLMQHSPFSWEIRGTSFIRAEKRSGGSVFFEKTMDHWVASLDQHQKKVFIDALFDAVEESGATRISDFTDDPVNATQAMYKVVSRLPKEDQDAVLIVLQKLGESSANQAIDSISEAINDLLNMFK